MDQQTQNTGHVIGWRNGKGIICTDCVATEYVDIAIPVEWSPVWSTSKMAVRPCDQCNHLMVQAGRRYR